MDWEANVEFFFFFFQSLDTNLLALKGFNIYSLGIINGIEWILHISLERKCQPPQSPLRGSTFEQLCFKKKKKLGEKEEEDKLFYFWNSFGLLRH